MPDPTASADPTAASRQRINITDTSALRDIDREVSVAGAEVKVAREQYRLAILAMLAQALSVEQLEEICHHAQWPLELTASDKTTAARAIISHIDKVVAEHERTERASAAVSDYGAVMRIRGAITLQDQIRHRWSRHIPMGSAL